MRGLPGTGLRRGARRRGCSTSSSRSPTTPSTSPTPTATGSSRTRRRGARSTTPSSTSPRCSPRCATTRTAPRSTSPSAGRSASRSRFPTSTVALADFTPVGRATSRGDRVRARRGAQRGREPRRAHRRRAHGERPVRVGLRLRAARRPDRAQQADDGVADQGRRVRLASASRARGCTSSRGARRRTLERRASTTRASRRCSPRPPRSWATAAATWEGTELAGPRPGVLQARAARASRRRCSASTSRTTRCSGRPGCSRGTRTTRSPRPRSSPSCPRATAASSRWAGS